ncbi:MAG: hypothetical protein IIY17_00485 [Aeriscardovia sp.]|nr:hypothetical protein [Aeriscardovia sp.]
MTPEFIRELRKKVGHERLWISGVEAYVKNERGEVLLAKRKDDGLWSLVAGIIEPRCGGVAVKSCLHIGLDDCPKRRDLAEEFQTQLLRLLFRGGIVHTFRLQNQQDLTV